MNIILHRVVGAGWYAKITDKYGKFDGLFIGTSRGHLIRELERHA